MLKFLIATTFKHQKPMQFSQKKIAEWNSKKDFFTPLKKFNKASTEQR